MRGRGCGQPRCPESKGVLGACVRIGRRRPPSSAVWVGAKGNASGIQVGRGRAAGPDWIARRTQLVELCEGLHRVDREILRAGCSEIEFSVPAARVSVGCPATVTRPGLVGCASW